MSDLQTRTSTAVLVDADWLIAHRRDPNVLILDARIVRHAAGSGLPAYQCGRESFARDGHIPGALHADLFDDFSDPSAAFPFTNPSAEQLGAALGRLGAIRQSHIIVYDSLNGAWAARLWWVLKAAGIEEVRVLDGGLAAWTFAGGEVEFGPQERPARHALDIGSQNGKFVDLAEVLSVVEGEQPSRLVCALQRREFLGTDSKDPRRGHIPGSLSFPYAETLDADGKLDFAALQLHAERLNLGRDDDMILYCGGGVNAAGLALGLAAIGFSRLRVYDGSLSEWKADPNLPLEIGPSAHSNHA